MKRRPKHVLALACGFAASIAMAQAPVAPSPTGSVEKPLSTVAVSAPALTQHDLATFFDGLVPFAMRRSDLAGGVIIVVKDGKVLFAQGYGIADLAKHSPVSADTSLFRPGSISKLFTWTAVMQLVEQGKLQLDRDVNDYLDFKIPPYQGKFVTLRNLMTHTGGFEEAARDLLPPSGSEINLERYLKTHLPARIFPAGQLVAYSNYGCGLAGYIVQRISGEKFEEYIARHIFKPLGMTESTFAQPLPSTMTSFMAQAYETASSGTPKPFELVNPAPAGALSTTATDMARFMIAQLQNGRYGDTQILQPATAELMHSPQYSPAPGMPGFDLGFYQEDRNGLRIIGHAGDTVFFHSDLHLLLDKNIGIFMSFNSTGTHDGGGTLMVRSSIFHAFLDRYFPQAQSTEPTLSNAKKDASRVAGWYQASRRNESALQMFYLIAQTKVAALPDGSLTVSMLSLPSGQPMRWREVGPLQYREVNGNDRLKFVANTDGSIRHWISDSIPAVEIFQRVPTAQSLGCVGPLTCLSIAIMLLSLLVWLAGWMTRRHYRSALVLSAALRRSRLLSRLGVLVLVTDVLGWTVLIITMAANQDMVLHSVAVPWMNLLYVLGVIALLGVLAIVAHTLHGLYRAQRSPWVRLGETLLGLAALYLGWFIFAFGLISFSTRF